DHVAAHGFERARLHVVPPFVDTSGAPRGLQREATRLLFVGALLRGKGLDVLLHALAALPTTFSLRVVGDGHQRALFESLTERLDLMERVRFLGRLDREALDDEYA